MLSYVDNMKTDPNKIMFGKAKESECKVKNVNYLYLIYFGAMILIKWLHGTQYQKSRNFQ